MSKKTLANNIINALRNSIGRDASKYDKSTPASANAAIVSEISKYIANNTTISSVYVGTVQSASPYPDPCVSDSHSVSGTIPKISGTTFQDWISDLWGKIKSSFVVCAGNNGVSFITPVKPFNGEIDYNSVLEKMKNCGNAEDPQTFCWEIIVGSIFDAINSSEPSSGPANRSTGNSTGSITSTQAYIS